MTGERLRAKGDGKETCRETIILLPFPCCLVNNIFGRNLVLEITLPNLQTIDLYQVVSDRTYTKQYLIARREE
jgi:hypothetical protein